MKKKITRFFFIVITFALIVLSLLMIYFFYHLLINDVMVFEFQQIVIIIGGVVLSAFIIQKISGITYPNSIKGESASQGPDSQTNPSSIPPNSQQEPTIPSSSISPGEIPGNSVQTPENLNRAPGNTSQTPVNPHPGQKGPTGNVLTRPKIIGGIIVIIIIIIILFTRGIIPFGGNPIVGTWINEEMVGPYYSDLTDTDYVYIEISEYYEVYGYGTLTINYVTTSGLDNVYGSGLWYIEDEGYRLEITKIGDDEEIFYVYIVDNELFLTQTQISWGFIKEN